MLMEVQSSGFPCSTRRTWQQDCILSAKYFLLMHFYFLLMHFYLAKTLFVKTQLFSSCLKSQIGLDKFSSCSNSLYPEGFGSLLLPKMTGPVTPSDAGAAGREDPTNHSPSSLQDFGGNDKLGAPLAFSLFSQEVQFLVTFPVAHP